MVARLDQDGALSTTIFVLSLSTSVNTAHAGVTLHFANTFPQ